MHPRSSGHDDGEDDDDGEDMSKETSFPNPWTKPPVVMMMVMMMMMMKIYQRRLRSQVRERDFLYKKMIGMMLMIEVSSTSLWKQLRL